MNNKAAKHNQPQSTKSPSRGFMGLSFRFRRWSRAGYAMFRSLTLCVTIGKLSSNVCEKAFCKLKGIADNVFDFVLIETGAQEDEHPDEYLEQIQLEQLLSINNSYTSNKSASAYALADCVFMCFLAVGIRIFLFQPLFLCK